MKEKITAKTISEALALRHAKDVWVTECKDGPTQCTTHSRLDGWAMEKSWAHPRTVGYEIKISRSDFLNDNKWQAYLPLCNELYFAAPKGLIQVGELSQEVGLIELVGTSRLVTRKKAAYRDHELPESLYRYILMCRARIQEDEEDWRMRGPRRGVDRWRTWLADKAESRTLGYEVSKAIREHVERVDRTNRELSEKMKTYDDVRSVLAHLGIKPDGWISLFDIKRKLVEAQSAFPTTLRQAIQDAASGLYDLQREVMRIDQQVSDLLQAEISARKVTA